ncbi:MAG TPA: MarR family winged helix-turn-helix transcriptional regulator [Beijerinckiaceae bacterium]|jgi:DNA-binding MarR family transcriptional regulator
MQGETPGDTDGRDGLEAIGKACFALHARMTARLLSRAYDAAMRPAGLRLAQFGILGAIGHGATGSETALAERLGLERTTLIRNLKLLAGKGWIEPVPGEGRGIGHRLTPSGRAALDAAIPLWKAAQGRIEGRLEGIDPDGARQAMRALRKAGR